MKQVNQYITEELVKWIDDDLGKTDDEGVRYVPRAYKGYISSMGASLIQSGLVPTMAFYNDQNREGGKAGEMPRHYLLRILRKMLEGKVPQLKEKSLPGLTASMRHDHAGMRALQKDLVNASIALKLTLRIFKLK